MLGVRRIAHHGIHIQGLPYLTAILHQRPVFIQRVGTSGIDVAGLYASHHKVHTGQVIGILLQLLGITILFLQ